MTQEIKKHRASRVQKMFAEISKNYDLMNRLMTFGLDISWRRFLVSMAHVPKAGKILDVGSGTGDIALEALKRDVTIHVTAVDFTRKMMLVGRKRDNRHKVAWCQSDALQLPFQDGTFDAVTSGFLVRNVDNVLSVFKEQVRVVKPGGRVVCLDTSPVPQNIIRPFAMFYLKVWVPFLGGLISGERDAYSYLPESTLQFMKPEKLADIMERAGLKDVKFRRFMFGTIAVHWGIRPSIPISATYR